MSMLHGGVAYTRRKEANWHCPDAGGRPARSLHVPCIATLVLLASFCGCTALPDKPTGRPSQALTDTGTTTLGQLASSAATADNAEGASPLSALAILDRGEDAFLCR